MAGEESAGQRGEATSPRSQSSTYNVRSAPLLPLLGSPLPGEQPAGVHQGPGPSVMWLSPFASATRWESSILPLRQELGIRGWHALKEPPVLYISAPDTPATAMASGVQGTKGKKQELPSQPHKLSILAVALPRLCDPQAM